jgi:hypothetical protein
MGHYDHNYRGDGRFDRYLVLTAMRESVQQAWVTHMKLGNFEDAWRISDELLRTRAFHSPKLPRHEQSVWDGSSLQNKRVLVRCYHGLGDTIQFIRYASLLKAIGSEMIVWSQPELIPLLTTFIEIDELLPLHNGLPEIDYDVDIEIMELPYAFRTTLETVPARIPYLHVRSGSFSRGERLAVGLLWSAGDWDQRRSISFPLLGPLERLASVDWYLLQKGEALKEATFGRLTDSGHILGLAETMCGLDLVITVDSMPAHLAGALGVPVWTLLPFDADWRWMSEREDSPWYPSMRLFRQESKGDWKGVIENVSEALTSGSFRASRLSH